MISTGVAFGINFVLICFNVVMLIKLRRKNRAATELLEECRKCLAELRVDQ